MERGVAQAGDLQPEDRAVASSDMGAAFAFREGLPEGEFGFSLGLEDRRGEGPTVCNLLRWKDFVAGAGGGLASSENSRVGPVIPIGWVLASSWALVVSTPGTVRSSCHSGSSPAAPILAAMSPPLGKLRNLLRSGLALQQRIQHQRSGDAEYVRQHVAQLYVGVCQHVEHRFPIRAGALHDDVRHLLWLQPIPQLLQFCGGRAEPPPLDSGVPFYGPTITHTAKNFFPASMPAHRSIAAQIISVLLSGRENSGRL